MEVIYEKDDENKKFLNFIKKKDILFFIIMGIAALTACADSVSVTTVGQSAQPETNELTDSQEEPNIPESSSEKESETEEPTPAEPQTYYLIENPSWEYYLKGSISSEDNISLKLEQLTEEPNEIIDTEKWFAENGLEQPFWNTMQDGTYRYEITGDDYRGCQLDVYSISSDEHMFCLDFSQYRYADDFKEEDRNFIDQEIWWAQSAGQVLYVAIGHNTYTASSPHTGYLVAIDLNDMGVIWKSEPCTTNAKTFAIVDNTIICGYGFTSEPDYLILVNRLGGTQLEKIPIKTQAEYIICKDNVLFVRAYNTNYTFQMYRAIDCS